MQVSPTFCPLKNLKGTRSTFILIFYVRDRCLNKKASLRQVLTFTPLFISRKICRHTKTMLEKTHCRTTSILLYLCTFQLWNTGCLPLSASSTFVYTFMILPAFQRTHTNQYSKPWNESLSRKNNKPCHHNNVRCYTRITGKRKHHHVRSRWTRSTVVCIPARNLRAFLREFMRIRVEWYNIMPTTVMLVTCALKRRNGTCTKHNIFNGAFNDIWDAIFTFIYKLEYILYFGKKNQRLDDSLDLAMLCYYEVYYFRTLLTICFTLISLHLRDFQIPCNVTKTRFCYLAI